jgi:hypothetical protein
LVISQNQNLLTTNGTKERKGERLDATPIEAKVLRSRLFVTGKSAGATEARAFIPAGISAPQNQGFHHQQEYRRHKI